MRWLLRVLLLGVCVVQVAGATATYRVRFSKAHGVNPGVCEHWYGGTWADTGGFVGVNTNNPSYNYATWVDKTTPYPYSIRHRWTSPASRTVSLSQTGPWDAWCGCAYCGSDPGVTTTYEMDLYTTNRTAWDQSYSVKGWTNGGLAWETNFILHAGEGWFFPWTNSYKCDFVWTREQISGDFDHQNLDLVSVGTADSRWATNSVPTSGAGSLDYGLGAGTWHGPAYTNVTWSGGAGTNTATAVTETAGALLTAGTQNTEELLKGMATLEAAVSNLNAQAERRWGEEKTGEVYTVAGRISTNSGSGTVVTNGATTNISGGQSAILGMRFSTSNVPVPESGTSSDWWTFSVPESCQAVWGVTEISLAPWDSTEAGVCRWVLRYGILVMFWGAGLWLLYKRVIESGERILTGPSQSSACAVPVAGSASAAVMAGIVVACAAGVLVVGGGVVGGITTTFLSNWVSTWGALGGVLSHVIDALCWWLPIGELVGGHLVLWAAHGAVDVATIAALSIVRFAVG